MRLELTVVDAFTDRPFTGNPAAVAVVETFPGDDVMQAVAMEMNHSETAFVALREDGGYNLRWFTPTAGVDCVSRVFGPNVGIPEDPVTGSAHCVLAVLWGERTARDELVGEQASARGGIVHMRRAGDRVVIGGRAVTVAEVRLRA